MNNDKRKLEVIELKDSRWVKHKLVKIPRPITLKVPLTGKKEVFDNIMFLCRDGVWDKPYLVRSFQDIEVPFFYHYNISSGIDNFNLIDSEGKQYLLNGSCFCNPIDNDQLYDNPRVASILLTLQLEKPYAGSAFDTSLDNYVSLKIKDYGIVCKKCDSFIPNNQPKLNLLSKVCVDCQEKYPDLLNNFTYETTGYYSKGFEDRSYLYTKGKPRSNKSEYYPIFKASELADEVVNIPKVEKDVIVMGLGSAGSNIVDQLIRTNMASNYIFIDFDKIEEKNLRNQCYINNDIGKYKSEGITRFCKEIKPNISCVSYNTKFQDVNLSRVKTKYIVLGFDSIKVRIEAFEKIKSGEIEAEYIIDTRYDDLDCSIYFVDTKNEVEMKHYEDNLLADYDNLKAVEINRSQLTAEDVERVCKDLVNNGTYSNNYHGYPSCLNTSKHYNISTFGCSSSVDCYSTECFQTIADVVNRNNSSTVPENTCIKHNIIDIYKFASSYITSCMREISMGSPKPFTHYEVSTNGFPKMMKLK